MSHDDAVPSRELVAGKYELTRLLGRGGMGSVWEGVHVTLHTRVAVKFIEAEYANSHEAIQRFENEAKAAAKLSTKHVVSIHDHGLMPDGRPYIVMEFLAGEPLDQRLARVGRLSVAETSQIITHVGRALIRAHEAGIVHRDLKPENIFLVRDEEDGTELAKVVDFGIAKFTDKSSGLSSSTKTGAVLGTPYFMSPEQARGLRGVDYRSDLWSMGVIAYRCVTGQMPFNGEAVGDLLVQICTAPLPVASQTAPGVPAGFDAWVARALAREPAQRFQSATELAEALAGVAGLPIASRPMNPSIHNASTISANAPLAAGGITAAPLTQSTGFVPPKKFPLGLVAAISGVAAVALIAGLVLVIKLASGPAAAASAEVGASTAGVELIPPSASAAPAVAPTVEETAAPVPSAAPSASAEPPPEEPVKAATPTKTSTKSVGTKTSTKTSGTKTAPVPTTKKDEVGY
jgi:serine/threonine protein kinase